MTETWFAANQRQLPWRSTYDPYHVWLSEIMLQQTRMEVVLPYFRKFLAALPTIEALAAASDDEVVALWSGMGYYRRARMLRAGAADVISRFGGVLPSRVEDLTTIPGIGRYTAGAIASIAFEQRAPIVDGNVARVVARLEALEHPVGSPPLMAEAWRHAQELVDASASPRALNQGLMELGALVCTPIAPSCDACPLRRECRAFATGLAGALPRKKAAAATRAMHVPLYLITDRKGRILMRREGGQLMTDLFHLPHGNTSLMTGEPLEVTTTASLGRFRHAVTTRRIEFEVFTAKLSGRVRDGGDEYAWIEPGELSAIPHPSYVTKALRLASKL